MPKIKECNVDDLVATINRMSSAEQENLLKLLDQLEKQMNEKETRHRAHHALDRAIRDFGDRAIDTDIEVSR